MVVFGIEAGKSAIRQKKPPPNGKMPEPAPQGVHRTFQFLLLLDGGYIGEKGQLLVLA